MQDIVNLIEEGKFLIAIKRYREAHNVGFREAERAVFKMKKEFTVVDSVGGHASDNAYDYHSICARVQDYLRDGHKLTAIKFYQENCSVDFNQALKAIRTIECQLS